MKRAPTGWIRLDALDARDHDVLRMLTSVRAPALVFSLPYLWSWSQGLPLASRLGIMLAHALALLAASTRNDTVDAGRDLEPRFNVARDPHWIDPAITRPAAQGATIASVACSVIAMPQLPLAPVGIGAALVAVWLGAALPAGRKYYLLPETIAPLMLLALPALGLRFLAGAAVAPLTVIAGMAMLAAVILAMHLRDREADLDDDVPTIATRRPDLARSCLVLSGWTGALAAAAQIFAPLGMRDVLALAGAGGFALGLYVRSAQVPLLVLAHALYAVSLLR